MNSNKKCKSEDIDKLRMILDDPLNPKNKELAGKDNTHLESLRLRLSTNSSPKNTSSHNSSNYQRNPDLLKPQVTIHNKQEQHEEKQITPKPTQQVQQPQKEQLYVQPKTKEEPITQPPTQHIEKELESEELIEVEKVTVPPPQFTEVKQKDDDAVFKERKEYISFSDKTDAIEKDESLPEENLPKWHSVDEHPKQNKDEYLHEKPQSNKPIQDFIEVQCPEKKPELTPKKQIIPEWQMVDDEVVDEKNIEKELKEQKIKKTVEEKKQEQEEVVEWQPIEEEKNDEPIQRLPKEDHKKDIAEESENKKTIETEKQSDKQPQLQTNDDSSEMQLNHEPKIKEDDQIQPTTSSPDIVEQKPDVQEIKESELEKNEPIDEWESIDEQEPIEEKPLPQDTKESKKPVEAENDFSEPLETEKKAKPLDPSEKTEEIFLTDFESKKSIQENDDNKVTESVNDTKTKKDLQRKEKEKLKQDKKMQKLLEKEKKRQERQQLKQKRKQKTSDELDTDISDTQTPDDSTQTTEKSFEIPEETTEKKTFTKLDNSEKTEKKFKVFTEKEKTKQETTHQDFQKEKKTSSDMFESSDSSEWESYAIDETQDNKPIAPAYTYGEFMLYKKEVKTAMGKTKTVHFFSKQVPDIGKPVELPDGYEVKVNKKTGLPYLKKI